MHKKPLSTTRLLTYIAMVLVIAMVIVQVILFWLESRDETSNVTLPLVIEHSVKAVKLQDTASDVPQISETPTHEEFEPKSSPKMTSDGEVYTQSAPHPWLEVRPSMADLELCRRLERVPIVYDEKTERFTDLYHLEIQLVYSRRYTMPLSEFVNQKFENKIYETVSKHLDKVYSQYIDWLGYEKLYQSDIKILIAYDLETYEALLDKYHASTPSNIPGVYLPLEHISLVHLPLTYEGYIDTNSLLRTTIHESVHAVNFVQFGYMHRWAQEGLAQYFAHFYESENPELFLDKATWDARSNYLGAPLLFDDVINTNEMWSDNRHALYASAFAFIQYLSTLSKADNPLLRILKFENKQPCSVVNKTWTSGALDFDGMFNNNVLTWFEYLVLDHEARLLEKQSERPTK
ncbi:DUF1570 domain-containing protein [Pseudoalteromonas xiamenensis]|uniref:hypothetical protein n=1 Tax=Pseudoalteromonas xiamenensis TaxID=882626 RepID=UPI0027E43747|nr:hypothetical protein [Pseudoalteromonas xiamenensis]WMN60718.1 DUF1570 domain-containing protein [Pseudoalteromonas xiamenensis]WMN60824.1 DUF1570 domain-containing protein [Pseudoalteromonas xiamenensis]